MVYAVTERESSVFPDQRLTKGREEGEKEGESTRLFDSERQSRVANF